MSSTASELNFCSILIVVDFLTIVPRICDPARLEHFSQRAGEALVGESQALQ